MNNRLNLLILFLILSIGMASAQQTVLNIAVSRDTVLLGNAFYIQYSFDMKDARLVTPSIKGGEVIAQNFVSNTSIIHGEIKVMHRQRYLIKPSQAGSFTIPATLIKSAANDTNGDLEIPSVEIYVKENPNNLVQDPEEDQSWQFNDILQGKNTSKRKSKKI